MRDSENTLARYWGLICQPMIRNSGTQFHGLRYRRALYNLWAFGKMTVPYSFHELIGVKFLLTGAATDAVIKFDHFTVQSLNPETRSIRTTPRIGQSLRIHYKCRKRHFLESPSLYK